MAISATKLKAKDTVFASLAECYCDINNTRYNFMQMINLEAKIEKNKAQVPILGQTGKGNKASGWTGSGSATLHYNQSVFRKMLAEYKETGQDIYFTTVITNDDPTSDAGTQTVSLIDCNIDGGVLAKFDADGEYLDEDVDFTFDDFSIDTAFNNLAGFKTSTASSSD